MRTKTAEQVGKLKTGDIDDNQGFDEDVNDWAKRIKWISRRFALIINDQQGGSTAEFNEDNGIADYYNAEDFVEYLGY